MKKIAIIGASYLQEPLIRTAKELGIETHVFAWQTNDVGEGIADYFYPISIVEMDQICRECQKIGIDGVCSIGSDLAIITVNFIADRMGLIGNSMPSTRRSTNKHLMRECFQKNGDPSPRSILVEQGKNITNIELDYPIIVKPTDRSGSRGITKLNTSLGLKEAIDTAIGCGFEGKALIEEYVSGEEYSVEYISYKGKHRFLALTQKYTTGSPHYIEIAHLEPAPVSEGLLKKIKAIVEHALSSLGIVNGASHTEIKVDHNEVVKIIEVGGRMGGDLIGSDLVKLSSGIDYVKNVIQIALGNPPLLSNMYQRAAAVRYVMSVDDIKVLHLIKSEHPEYIVKAEINEISEREILDSSQRFGWFLLQANSAENLLAYMP